MGLPYVGWMQTVDGTMRKNGIERHIDADRVWDVGESDSIAPLGMPNGSIGGGALGDSPGITNGVGLYNVGLLVRAWGEVTYAGPDFLYVNDGSNVEDGNSLPATGVSSTEPRPAPDASTSSA